MKGFPHNVGVFNLRNELLLIVSCSELDILLENRPPVKSYTPEVRFELTFTDTTLHLLRSDLQQLVSRRSPSTVHIVKNDERIVLYGCFFRQASKKQFLGTFLNHESHGKKTN